MTARSPLSRVGLLIAGAVALALALAGIAIAWQYSRVTQDLPAIEGLPALLDAPDGILLQPTRLYDRSGAHLLLELANPAAPARSYLYLPGRGGGNRPQVSGSLVTATLAAADPYFSRHSGYTLVGLFSGEQTTVAQRLASELLLHEEPDSLRRSIRERLLAAQITHRYGRESVLEWYLNGADYGRLAYGVDAAARLYFGKSAAEVNLAEAALLAGAALDPQKNPIDNPSAAFDRQKQILLKVLEHRLAPPQAVTEANRQPVEVLPGPHPGQALQIEDLAPKIDSAFLRLVLQQVESRIPQSQLERGGLKILTTLDYDLQQQVACIARAQTGRLQGAEGAVAAADCSGARLLPGLETPIAPLPAQAHALVIHPQSGQVLALAIWPASTLAADRFSDGPLPAHSIGTLGTPLIYLAGFARGLGPASLVWDIPPAETPLAPGLAEAGSIEYHGPVRLRVALANDYLPPADHLIEQIGPENVWRTLQQFGLAAPRNPQSTTNRAGDLFRAFNMLEVGKVFGILANGGLLAGQPEGSFSETTAAPPPIRPTAMLRVETVSTPVAGGSTRLDWSSWQTRPIISAQLAYLMTHVLSDETTRWPSLGHPNPLEIGRPNAAKIGKLANGSGAWTSGYTKERVAVVWIGLPPEDAALEAASNGQVDDLNALWANAAAGLYHAVMKTANQDRPVEGWQPPEGITTVRVCDPSGMLPTIYCPNVADEVFLTGNEPLQADRLFNSVAVNRLTGRLATIFTPPDLIEEQPYLLPPPEAAGWAGQAGLNAPPTVYDTITGVPVQFPDAQITSPAMLAVVRGQVPISGTAAGPDFSFFRIQIGEGLNPRTWTQIGEDSSNPVRNNLLGIWDTRGLSGLYALEILTVMQDQSVQRSAVLVTIDNQPPQVEIVSPVLQEEVSQVERPEIVFLALVEDDLAINNVQMLLDGELLANFSRSPYAFSWTGTIGAHRLQVIAVDQAGNSAETAVNFLVRK